MRGNTVLFAFPGNMYMDTRQSMSSMMGPPGYPHMPPMSSAGPTMTGPLLFSVIYRADVHSVAIR